jgi:hypothetical protein
MQNFRSLARRLSLPVVIAAQLVGACAHAAPPAKSAPAQDSATAAAEDWKGEPPVIEVDFGALTGLGFYGGTAGFALLGTVAKKVINRGFAPDINNQLYFEAQLGPMFFENSTPWFISTHLRWDFIRNETWTPYALGGLAGYIGGNLNADWPVKPRLGLGSFWNVSPAVTLRGEVSSELFAAGVSFAL